VIHSWAGRLLLALPLALLATGCGSGRRPLTPVHGKVYCHGTALSRGTIVFTPDASRGHCGPLARSAIQPDGSYSLRTDSHYGAAPGWYRVTVIAVELVEKPAAGDRFATAQSLLPEKYRDPELAGLVREIKAGCENAIDFHLD
jgi:hypothetical protein